MVRIRKNKGAWTREEHEAFLSGLRQHGSNSHALAPVVPTRSALQIRTHSQKYFDKIERGEKFPAQPYPSQYDAASGKSCITHGAYEYGAVNQQDQEQQQPQQQPQQQQLQQEHQLQQEQQHGPPTMISDPPVNFMQQQQQEQQQQQQQQWSQWEHWNREQDELAAFAKWDLLF
ncbi:unnamed protein product [Ectocarpus sp. 8 AP-2014]